MISQGIEVRAEDDAAVDMAFLSDQEGSYTAADGMTKTNFVQPTHHRR
jgi:hypothetical protein